MSVLIVKSTMRQGKGVIQFTDGSVNVQVKKPPQRQCYAVFVEGVSKGVTRLTAEEGWIWLKQYFGVTSVKAPELKKKKK